MANNIIKYNSRITLKYDSLTNWNAVKNTFTPLKGEVCIVNPSENLGSDTTDVLIKVGDGKHTFAQLEYISAKAADVYAWAKAKDIEYNLENSHIEFKDAEGTVTDYIDLSTITSAIEGLNTATNTTIPGLIEGAVDALGKSLIAHETEKTSVNSQTNTFISHIDYDADKNEATPYYTSVQFPTVDSTLKDNSLNAIANNAVYDETQAIRSLVIGVDNRINDLSCDDPTASDEEATTVITNVSQKDGLISATKKTLPTFKAPEADGTAVAFIDSVSQDKGKITATKKTIPNASASTAGIATLGASGGAATYDALATLEAEVAGIETKISNAMHFLGITSTSLSDGAETNPITIIVTKDNTKSVTLTEEDAGAVVLSAVPSSTDIQYEYVWTGSAWAQLGQEGSFAVKGSIVHTDIADNAAIEQTKIASTLGKDDLAGDISDIDARLDAIEEKNGDQDSNISAIKSYSKIEGDSGSATAEVVNDTLTINGDKDIITVAVTDLENNDKVTISHKKVTKADDSSLTEEVKLTPNDGEDTFTAVDSIVYDAYGHVSAVKTKTVTVDVTDINSKIGGLENGINNHKSFSTVKAGSTNLVADGINDTLNVAAGTAISVTGNASTDTMTIAHANVTRTDASPIDKPTVKVALDHQTAENGKQDKFVAVTGVTTNAQGHVTAVEHTEFTMPNGEEIDSRIGILERDTWKTVTRNKVTQVDDNTNGNFTTGLQDSKGNSTLNKSDLTIGTDVIGYIIWDCGSASKNI